MSFVLSLIPLVKNIIHIASAFLTFLQAFSTKPMGDLITF